MSVRRMVLIVNPFGGLKTGKTIFEKVKPVLEAGGFELEIIETKYPKHARDITNSIDLEPYECIGAIGGDGTMHEVLNGLLTRPDQKQIPIGLIPAGTGNSFMHSIDCLDPVEATKLIIKGYTKKIDVAEIQMEHRTMFAFNIIGWGLITDLSVRAENIRWMGESRYTYSAVMEIMRAKKRHTKLFIEGEEFDEDFIFILGCITQYAGRGMKMAPLAKLGDGLIDILVVRDASRRQMLNLFPKVFTGEHIHSDILEYKQVTDFAIIPDEYDVLNIDGELVGSTPITVKIRRDAFSAYLNPDFQLT